MCVIVGIVILNLTASYKTAVDTRNQPVLYLKVQFTIFHFRISLGCNSTKGITFQFSIS